MLRAARSAAHAAVAQPSGLALALATAGRRDDAGGAVAAVQCRTVWTRPQLSVVLKEAVDNLGRKGEIVKVAAGHARNFLVPQGLAAYANKRLLEGARTAKAAAADASTPGAAAGTDDLRGPLLALKRLQSKPLVVIRSDFGPDGKLKAPVTASALSRLAASQLRVHLPAESIDLKAPLAAAGRSSVPLRSFEAGGVPGFHRLTVDVVHAKAPGLKKKA